MANIFDYATSELSQDAFLCWMFASLGGDLCEKTKSKQTYEIVRKIIFDLIDVEDTNQEVKVLWIQKQWHGIDVVIELMIADVMYAVAFEDKYYSSVHNVSNTDENQLIIYRKRLLEYWDNEKYKRDTVPLPNHIKTIYYKRAFFNDWESYLKDALTEWKFFDILDIIKLFKTAFVGYKDL